MMTKHTPGPWQAVQMYSDALTVLDPKGFEIVEATRTAILPDYEERLGVGHWALSEHAHRDLSDEEQAANARLIAAAPELLEALEKRAQADAAYAQLVLSSVDPDTHERLLQQIEDAEDAAKDAARAAIAKARGAQ